MKYSELETVRVSLAVQECYLEGCWDKAWGIIASRATRLCLQDNTIICPVKELSLR